MSHKTRNIIILSIFLFLITLTGVYLTFFIQTKKIKKIEKEISLLNKNYISPNVLAEQLKEIIQKCQQYDSMITNSKKILPYSTKITDVYKDLIKFSTDFSDMTKIDIEFVETKTNASTIIDKFNIRGIATYEDFYNYIYSIEKSKRLYKIMKISSANQIVQTENNSFQFLVGFSFTILAYSTNDKNMVTSHLFIDEAANYTVPDIFYPLILPEIPKNNDDLVEIEGAELLALFYDGAFLVDKKGISHILQEGDEVFLGRLTKIDYNKSECEFVLNKGGITEKVILKLKNDYQKGVKN